MIERDIHIGARYVAKVSGVLTVVKVLAKREVFRFGKMRYVWDVLNTRTQRCLVFKSAQRFRSPDHGSMLMSLPNVMVVPIGEVTR